MTGLNKLFKKLQTDAKSVLFTKETISAKVLKRLKKSKYNKDIEFVNLFKGNIDFLDDEKKKYIPIKTTFFENKDDINRSTLNRFNGLFQLLHADIGNSEFLGKSASNPKYCLLFADLFTSKGYIYPMKSRNLLQSKWKMFYKEVEGQRNGQKQGLKQTSTTLICFLQW